MDCEHDGIFMWKGQGTSSMVGNIINMLRQHHQKDNIADDVWISNIPKVNLLLWRLRWRHLPTTEGLKEHKAANVNLRCVLCNEANETLDHIFFAYIFSWILGRVYES